MPAQHVPELTGVAVLAAEVVLPDQNTSLNTNINEMLVFQSAALAENVFTGEATYTLRYTTKSLDFLEKVISAAKTNGTPSLRFRLGYGVPQNMDWRPWQTVILVKQTSMPTNIGEKAGHVVDLYTSNALFAAGRVNKTVARKGTIAAIVGQIAAENGLPAVIEDTEGEFDFIQNYIDDTHFVRTRLLPRAISTSGHGAYLFFVRDNVLHFHSPDYEGTFLELNYYEGPHMNMGEVNDGQQLIDQGVSGTRLIAYDPYSGDIQEVNSNPDTALKLADSMDRIDKLEGSQLNILYHLGSNAPKEAEALAQNAYERSRLSHQKVILQLQKIIDIRAGDFLNLIVSPGTNRASIWSGVWLVSETNYLIKSGAVTASLVLVRGEMTKNLDNIVAAQPNLQLAPEQDAPGRALSLRGLQSSALTVGASNETSSTGLVPVLDRNTLPA